MRIALVSIGHCPSLALRNIRTYCLAQDDVRGFADFEIYDYNLRDFQKAREQPAQQWSFATKFDEALAEFIRTKPEIIAFSCYLWNTDLSLHLAQLIRQVLPGTSIVLGGPDAGPRAPELLERYEQVDMVVDGDGEIPFLGLVRQFLAASEPDLAAVPALRYRSCEGLIANPAPSEAIDMSQLRGVCEDLPRVVQAGGWGWPYVLYETLRGCPYSCSYCMYGKTKMNEKDTSLAVEELLGLLQQGLVVNIIDPTFTTYQKRAKQILRALCEQEYSGGLYFEAYPDSIDEEMASLMAGARVSCVGMGFQTISSEGLKAVRRPKNLRRFERAVRLLRAHQISHYADLIYGLPDTTVNDFLASLDYLYSLEIPTLVIYRLLGLPGSPMMADAGRYGLVFNPSPPYELLGSNTYSLDDLIFCERFQQAFRDLPRRLRSDDLRALAAELGGISSVVKGFMTAAAEDLNNSGKGSGTSVSPRPPPSRVRPAGKVRAAPSHGETRRRDVLPVVNGSLTRTPQARGTDRIAT